MTKMTDVKTELIAIVRRMADDKEVGPSERAQRCSLGPSARFARALCAG